MSGRSAPGPDAHVVAEPVAPQVGEYIDDPAVALARKRRVLEVVSILDVVSYAVLLVPMYKKWIEGDHSDLNFVALRVAGFFHGLIWVAYTFMTIDVARPLRWSYRFLAVAILPPLVGGIVCHLRLRQLRGAQPSSSESASSTGAPLSARRSKRRSRTDSPGSRAEPPVTRQP